MVSFHLEDGGCGKQAIGNDTICQVKFRAVSVRWRPVDGAAAPSPIANPLIHLHTSKNDAFELEKSPGAYQIVIQVNINLTNKKFNTLDNSPSFSWGNWWFELLLDWVFVVCFFSRLF